MHILSLCVKVRSRNLGEFEQALPGLLDATSVAPGRISRSLTKDMLEPCFFWYREEWKNIGAMELYARGAGFRKLLGAMKVLGDICEASVVSSDHLKRLDCAFEET